VSAAAISPPVLGSRFDGATALLLASVFLLLLLVALPIGWLTGHTGAVDRAHVVTAKAGLAGLTKALADDLAGFNITVNYVSPGMMDTVRKASSAHGQPAHHATRTTLTGRRGHPEEVAAAVRWLAGPSGRFVSGRTIHVNGGSYLGG
jgi:3-oxoacyl-[acyl-carrier protein] reductase